MTNGGRRTVKKVEGTLRRRKEAMTKGETQTKSYKLNTAHCIELVYKAWQLDKCPLSIAHVFFFQLIYEPLIRPVQKGVGKHRCADIAYPLV